MSEEQRSKIFFFFSWWRLVFVWEIGMELSGWSPLQRRVAKPEAGLFLFMRGCGILAPYSWMALAQGFGFPVWCSLNDVVLLVKKNIWHKIWTPLSMAYARQWFQNTSANSLTLLPSKSSIDFLFLWAWTRFSDWLLRKRMWRKRSCVSSRAGSEKEIQLPGSVSWDAHPWNQLPC